MLLQVIDAPIFVFNCVPVLTSFNIDSNHPFLVCDLQSVQQVVTFLVLEMFIALELFFLRFFLRKRPTDIFADGLNIVKFVETNFPDKILQIVDPDQILENQHDGFVSQ